MFNAFYSIKKIIFQAAMELIRLTDSKLINQLTFDKSDSFYWLRQQARRGVASAQVKSIETFFTKEIEKNHLTSHLASFRFVNVCRSKWFDT